LRFLDRMRYCESPMFMTGFGTSRHPHKHPHNSCPNLPDSGVSAGIPGWSLLAAKLFNSSGHNQLRDTREHRRTPLTGGIGVLTTQRSKVQILPRQAQIVHRETDRSGSLADRLQFCHQICFPGSPECSISGSWARGASPPNFCRRARTSRAVLTELAL
jgi:hypothetical protein